MEIKNKKQFIIDRWLQDKNTDFEQFELDNSYVWRVIEDYKRLISTTYEIFCVSSWDLKGIYYLFVDGEEKGIIAFAPYRLKIDEMTKGNHTIEFILYGNRINTFGGMHNISQPKWVGPNFWRSEGDQWCYEYILKDIILN